MIHLIFVEFVNKLLPRMSEQKLTSQSTQYNRSFLTCLSRQLFIKLLRKNQLTQTVGLRALNVA